MKVSKHAEDRLRERNGLNKKSCQRIAEKAYNDGIEHNQTKGHLFKWVSNLYLKGMRKGSEIKLYGDKAFIFCDDILITVLQIPSDLARDLKALTKERS